MDNDSNPEFAGYLHAIARRKALLLGVAIPIAVLAILLALALPDQYTSSALIEIDEPNSAASMAETSGGASYADQYVTNLKGIVLTDGNLRKMASEHDLYPEYAEDDSAALQRLKRDISVSIVTTPILDPRTGREREVVDAFTLSFDHRRPERPRRVRSGSSAPSWPNTAGSARAARPTPRSSTRRKRSACAPTWRSSNRSSPTSSARTTASSPSSPK
jgi:hypothetical protein